MSTKPPKAWGAIMSEAEKRIWYSPISHQSHIDFIKTFDGTTLTDFLVSLGNPIKTGQIAVKAHH